MTNENPKHIQPTSPTACCGCTACASICPTKAISMQTDSFGFLYPNVDETRCTNCGLCSSVCTFHADYTTPARAEPDVYGCRHKEDSDVMRSQSGGAVWALVNAFLQQEGVVYGAVCESVTHIVHKRAVSIEECQAMRGSKYVQSDIRGIFPQLKADLQAGKRVLFTGTACQIAGLLSYLPKKLHEQLTTIDLVCHGVPSPAVWKSYVEYVEKKYAGQVISVNFRDKKYGWHAHNETFRFQDGREVMLDYFRKLFYAHRILRPSCSACPFTNFRRVSDITVSDFWGWEKYHSEWNDDRGVSLMLVNTEKGELLRKDANLHFIASNREECLQPQLQHPAAMDWQRYHRAQRAFEKGGFEALAKNEALIGWPLLRQRIIWKLKSLIGK